jgi:hypothetical protein
MLREHHNPYISDIRPTAEALGLDTGAIRVCSDPPLYTLLFEPLTLMPRRIAYWTWIGLNTLALVVSLSILLASCRLSRYSILAFTALSIMSAPIANHFYYSQSKLLILLILVFAMRWLRTGYDAAGGIMIALAVLVRIYPIALVGFLLLRGRWRSLAYSAIALAIGAVATIAIVGRADATGFVLSLGSLTEHLWQSYTTNVAISSFTWRWVPRVFGDRSTAGLDVLRWGIVVAVQLGVLALTTYATLTSPKGSGHDMRLYSLWIVTAVLVSPVAWISDLVLLLIPFALIVEAAACGNAPSLAVKLAVSSAALMFLVCPSGCVNAVGESVAALLVFRLRLPGLSVIRESATISFMLAYAATYVFATAPDSEGLA